jgi:hypothetical protein
MKKIFSVLLLGGVVSILFSFIEPGLALRSNGKQSSAAKLTPAETITISGLQTKKFIPPKAPGSGGDNDFFGHGPKVNVRVEIYVKAEATLYARITFNATEVSGDGSTASGTREELIYFAGWGNKILSINSPTVCELIYSDDNHNEDYVGGNGRVRAHEARAYWNTAPSFVKADDLVRFCVINGDTDGPEIGTRTGVRVFFNPVSLTVQKPVPALIGNFSLNVTGVSSCGESTCSASSGAGLLHYYGFNTVTCAEFWSRERSVGHFVNWARDNGIANMGMPPNVLRDKLKDWKNDVQLRNLANSNYIAEIQKIIRDQRRPVIALVAWGSRCVEDYYAPTDDSYGIGNAIVHYIIIDGWDKSSTGNQLSWHILDNGVRKSWTDDYFRSAFFWKPENFAIEGILYPQDVHPGNIVY